MVCIPNPPYFCGFIDFWSNKIIVTNVGLDRSRPAYPRHFAQALHFARTSGRGLGAMHNQQTIHNRGSNRECARANAWRVIGLTADNVIERE